MPSREGRIRGHLEPRGPFAATRRFGADEQGMMSMTVVVAVLAFLALAGLVANVASTIRHKIEAQNSADALARSLAVHRARGLNAITATNHLVGELLALVILQHAIGGDELDGQGRALNSNEMAMQPRLKAAYKVAQALAEDYEFVEGLYDDVYPGPAQDEGATLRYSRLRLQQVLTWTYQAVAIGSIAEDIGDMDIPYVSWILGPIGEAALIFAKIFELKVKSEWMILDGLHKVAGLLGAPKSLLINPIIPLLYSYEPAVLASTQLRAEKVIRTVEAPNRVDGYSFPLPPLFDLPVAPEPTIDQLPADAIARSQLIRATYPWVVYWRKPIREMMDWPLRLSLARVHYRKFTDLYTRTKCLEQQQDYSVRLYVLADLDLTATDKGHEPWTVPDGSNQADQRFGVLAVAHRQPPQITSSALFNQANPDGIFAYAQALTYNANPQVPSPPGDYQPRIGWDTLNWNSGSQDGPATAVEYFYPSDEEPSAPPLIHLNWQAKLVPVRGRMLAGAVEGNPSLARRRSLRDVLPFALKPTTRTH
jgi:hypothetical protein